MKKLLLLIMVVSLAGVAGAASVWIRPTVDGPGNWNDAANWNAVSGTDGGVPTSATNVTRTATGNPDNLAEIQVTDTQTFGLQLRHGYDELNPTTDGPLLRIMNGGSIIGPAAAKRTYIGHWSKAKMIVEAGGTYTTPHRMYIGYNLGAHGTVDVYGTVNVTNQDTKVGDGGDGILNIFPGGVYNAQDFGGNFTIGTANSYVNLIGDGRLSTAGDDLANANALIAGGRFAAWGVLGAGVSAAYDGTNTTITADPNDPLNRTPEYNAQINVIASLDVDLGWLNLEAIPDPCSSVWVDVWFGTDTTYGPKESDPNIYEYADFTKVVDAGVDTTAKTVTVSEPSTDPNDSNAYYWRVDTYRHGDPNVVFYGDDGDPNTTDDVYPDAGLLMRFIAAYDFAPTVVHNTPPTVHWKNEPITVQATVYDEGTSAVTVLWDSGNESEPNITWAFGPVGPSGNVNLDGDYVIVLPAGTTYPYVVSATVKVNYATDNYNVRVRVTDSAGTHRPDHVVHQCRQDACDAARYWRGQNSLPQGPETDVNDDCAIDMVDIKLLAEKWLFNYAIGAATEIP